MAWYKNLMTSSKLFIGYGSIAALFFIALIFSYFEIIKIQNSQEDIFNKEFAEVVKIRDMRIDINSLRGDILQLLLAEDTNRIDEVKKNLFEVREKNKTFLSSLSSRVKDNSKMHNIVQRIHELLDEVHQIRIEQEFPYLESGAFDEANNLGKGIIAVKIDQIRQLSNELTALETENAQKSLLDARQLVNDYQRSMAIAVVLIIVIILFQIRLTSNLVALPLAQLTAWANEIACGNLSGKPKFDDRQDEVGLLSQAFQRMSLYLQNLAKKSEKIANGDLAIDVSPVSSTDQLGNAFINMVHYLKRLAHKSSLIAEGDLTIEVVPVSELDELGLAFSSMVRNLRRLASELQSGVSILSEANQEILSSATQVSTSAQETATSISEITATIEEIKQTAVVTSQKATKVNDTAPRTLLTSKEGQEAIASMLKEMQSIREQMHAVAESILRLSEQSQAIAEIVTTVDDLAEQTNLLGVNASIEAAKSGEQGRGFSVVAQEVKMLADQSKRATTQARTILNDIQKALSKAVIVAEQSSKAVEGGYSQVLLSDNSIKALAKSIEESSGAALQIAASSQQQLAGVDQVAQAMESIRSASNENVKGTKQTEQAVRNLTLLGKKLQEQLLQFKV